MNRWNGAVAIVGPFFVASIFATPLIKCYVTKPPENYLIALLTVVAVSIAYGSFFMSYQNNFQLDYSRRAYIKKYVSGLICSTFIPLLSISFYYSGVNFDTKMIKIVFRFPLAIFGVLSIYFFSFCLVKLWYFAGNELSNGDLFDHK